MMLVLLLAVDIVGGVGDDVVPGVVFEDVVGRFEVALAELEGGGTFGVCGGGMGAVGWNWRSRH